jgi:hypothetical protein
MPEKMTMRNLIARCAALLLAVFLLLPTIPALAADKEDALAPPQSFSKLTGCKAIADSVARLACYDKAVVELEQAVASKQVYLADKEEIKRTRKGLFGFSLPKLGLFGGDDSSDESNQIEAVIAKSYQASGRNGPWTMILEDGAKWVQTDGDLFPYPKAGQPIKIRKATMGAFVANVNGQRGVHVERKN